MTWWPCQQNVPRVGTYDLLSNLKTNIHLNSFDTPIFYFKDQLLFQLKVHVKEVKKSAETIADVTKCVCRMAQVHTYAYVVMATSFAMETDKCFFVYK